MLQDDEVKKEFLDNYRYAHDFWAPFVQDAKIYTLAQSGYTWTDAERKKLIKDGREPLEFNIMRRPQQFYSGYLRDNVNSIVIAGVDGSDEETADQLTKVSSHIWDKADGFPIFLDACDESFKSGISLCGLRMDYTNDFVNGDLGFYKRTYNSFYLDPTFENINLNDCGFAIMRDLVNKETAKALLPFIDPTYIDEIQSGFRDDKFLSYHPQFSNLSKNRNLLAYDQYYKRTSRQRLMLIDNKTGFFRDITEIEDDEKKKLEMGILRLERLKRDPEINPEDIPSVEIKHVSRPFIELSVMLNGNQVYVGEDKTKITEMYPFAPCVCYMEPSIFMASQRIQGIASTQWSMQRQFNKRHMKIIDMMDSDISKGYAYLIGALPNPMELQQTGQNKLIGVSQEGNPAGLDAIRELNGGSVNPAVMEYSKMLDDLSLTLANITESVIGIDEKGNDQISGKLAQVRIAQGLRSSRKIFDNVEKTQEILGKLVLLGIQKNYPLEKIERIINETPTDQFKNDEFEQYDSVIKEGVRSKSQKDAYYYELINLKREGIVDVPEEEIVRALQMSGISDLEKAIAEQNEKKAEQQEKIDEQEQVKLKLGNAKVESDLAMAGERRARIQSDLALATERISESEENRAQAALAKAKTITEIAALKDDRILKVLDFVNMLERQEVEDRELIGLKVEDQAQQIEQTVLSEPQAPQQEPQPQAPEQGPF